jgi:LmbE family N-acetylglucosaminyl deacetylase
VFQFPLRFEGDRRHRSHSDDIEIGWGATPLALTRAHPDLDVTWVVFGAQGVREDQARASGEAFLAAAGRPR